MGVDFLVCGICGETFPDCGIYYHCGGCEDCICEICYDSQKEKYGISSSPEVISDWAEQASSSCLVRYGDTAVWQPV